MSTIFKYTTYLELLQQKIQENQNIYGYKAKLAEVAQCQRSYLSQILIGKTHLTEEQAHRLAGFWLFSTLETKYFLCLVLKCRAGSRDLENFYEHQLQELRQEEGHLAKRFATTDIPQKLQDTYYSHWIYSAIHMLATVPGFQDLNAIAERLQIPRGAVEPMAKELVKMGYLKRQGTTLQATQKALHISKDSHYNFINHQNWRSRAVFNAAMNSEKSIHYTAVYSLSYEDQLSLHNLILEWIDTTRKIVGPSKEEEVVCFSCDFFRI